MLSTGGRTSSLKAPCVKTSLGFRLSFELHWNQECYWPIAHAFTCIAAAPALLPPSNRGADTDRPTDRLAMVLNRPETDRHCGGGSGGGVIGRTVVFTPSLYTGCSIKAYHISYLKGL